MVGVLGLLTSSVSAYSASNATEQITQVANNFAHENMICGAYYMFVSKCMGNRGSNDKPLADQYMYAAKIFVGRSISAGKTIGLSDKATNARMSIAIDDMKSDTENNCINISVLYQKYAHKCKSLMDDGPSELAAKLKKLGVE